MRKLLFFILFAAPALFAQKSYKDITFPPLGKIEIPEVTDIRLDNGIRLYLIEDHTLPKISISAQIGARTTYEAADRVGLGDLVGTVIRTGGTRGGRGGRSLTGDQIDERLEAVGASIEGSVNTDVGEVSLWVLKDNFRDIFPIFVDILRNPVFDQKKLDLAKIELRTGIARRNDEPFDIAGREYDKLIYGDQSPYARTVEYATLDNIKREDLVAFHKKYFVPGNIRLGIIGDFDTKAMIAEIKKALGDWKGGTVAPVPVPTVEYDYRPSVNLAHKAGLEQTTVLMGHIGTILKNPDYPALRVMNEILGGGFSGRLLKDVRSTRGLAYVVYGWYSADYDHPGVFYLGAQTKADSTRAVIDAIRAEVEKIQREPVTDDELKQAKDSYLNSYVFQLDTKGKTLWRMMTLDYYGYPRDFFTAFKDGVERVTKDDVLRVAKQYLHPDQLAILAVGDSTTVKPVLLPLGKINTIDINRAEKEPVPTAAAATPAAAERAQTILKTVADRTGGLAKLKAITSIVHKGNGTLKMQGKEIPMTATTALVFPDKVWVSTEMMGMNLTEVHVGKQGWVKSPQGEHDQNGENEISEAIIRNTINLLRNLDNPDYSFQFSGEEKGLWAIIARHKDGAEVKLFIDRKTYQVVKTTYQGNTPQGPGEIEADYSDFRRVDGISIPYLASVKMNGQQLTTMHIETVEINKAVDPKWFEK